MLRYAPDGKSALGGAHTPVRAYGIQAAASYQFRKPPKGWHRETINYGRSTWDRECEGLDWRKTDFFSGPDGEGANDRYYAMLLAGQAVAAGKVKPECKSMGASRSDPVARTGRLKSFSLSPGLPTRR